MSPQPQTQPANLREAILMAFNIGELRALCMDLGINAEDLAGPDAPRPELVEALLRDCLKRAAIVQLRQKLQTERPNLFDWPNLLVPELALDARDPYNVEGLANPFLGLKLFTYDDRAAYTGRDAEIDEALRKLSTPGDQQVMLWVTGASGSGKSSFAQAGVVPALERFYAKRNRGIRYAVFRPGRHPMAALKDALQQVGIASIDGIAPISAGAPTSTEPSPVTVLVLDQFEELFTQSDDTERDNCFRWLAALPTFEQCQMHLIITLRADYLDELHEVDALWPRQQACSIPLHAMRAEDLKLAIQKPLQVRYPGGEKRFEPALLDKLASDASAGASLLPLLQVTLEDLWHKGQLVLSAYGNLSDAITRRANEVLDYKDHDRPHPSEKRDSRQRDLILDIFLGLVNVSLDDDPRRDVRVGRLKAELATDRDTAKLIDDLSTTRLLSIDVADDGEVVNIVHESLIRDWATLRENVRQRRQQLQQRARFEQALEDWENHATEPSEYLLTGIRLAQAQELERIGDVCTKGKSAKAFLRDSRNAAERQRTLVRRRRYIIALTIITTLALGLGVALWRWRDALARQVAFASIRAANTQPDLALLLAEHASQTAFSESNEVRQGILAGVQRVSPQLIAFLNGHTDRSWDVAFNHDSGKPMLASVGDDGRLILWDLNTRQKSAELTAISKNTSLYSVAFSPDDKLLAAGDGDGNVVLWSTDTRQVVGTLPQHRANVLSIAFSRDGTRLVSGGSDGNVIVWDVATRAVITTTPSPHSNWVWSVAFSPDGRTVASGARDSTARIWDTQASPGTVTVTQVLTEHAATVTAVAFTQVDGKVVLASGDVNGRLRLWNMTTWASDKQKPASLLNQSAAVNNTIWGLDFSADGQRLLATSSSSWMQVWQLDFNTSSGALVLSKITPYLHGHSRSTMRGKFAPDGQTFATASFTGLVGWWRIEPGHAYVGHRARVLAVQPSDNDQQVRSLGDDGTLLTWNTVAHTQVASLTLPLAPKTRLMRAAFTADGAHIAAASDTSIWVWDKAGQVVFDSDTLSSTFAYTDAINDFAFGPNNTLITADENGQIVLWDWSSRALKAKQIVPAGQVYRVALSGNGQWWATGGCKSPNNSQRGSSCGRSEVRLWRSDTLQPLTQFDPIVPGKSGAVSALAFDASDGTLAIGSQDGSVMLWNLSAHSERGLINPLDGEVTALAFSPNRNDLAVATLNSHNILLYALSNLQPIGAEFAEHRGRIDGLVYAKGGLSLYSAAADGFAMRWDLDDRNWHTQLCTMANRNLSQEEYALYVGDLIYRKTCPQFP